jgi:hypothetical protein
MARHVALMGRRGIHMLLVEKSERKRPLGSSRYRWLDNIKMNLGEIGWRGMDSFGLA